MTADLACDALRMALWRRRKPRVVIMHTDRGSQYCSAAHWKLVRDMALEYAEYYVGMLRENGGKSAECLARQPQ